jgi:hypothetical protein
VQDIFFFAPSSPAVRATQPRIEWLPWVQTRGYSGRDVKLTTHLRVMPRSGMTCVYLHSPIALHGICLVNKDKGTSPLLLYLGLCHTCVYRLEVVSLRFYDFCCWFCVHRCHPSADRALLPLFWEIVSNINLLKAPSFLSSY